MTVEEERDMLLDILQREYDFRDHLVEMYEQTIKVLWRTIIAERDRQ